MKLSKIYSNKTIFKPIIFNPGFNVIYGDVEKNKELNEETGEHNIGKTSLVYLIDFLLLKGIDKKGFFGKNKEKLSDWVFYLEIELNDGKFLTIKRAVNPNTKISFKEHYSKNQIFTMENNWDYEDLSINSTIQEDNPKYILQKEYLKFDVLEQFNYRSFLSYLLRTQNDYQDVFKINKFKGKDIDWKPLLYKLLGFESNSITKKYELEEELKNEENILEDVQSKLEGEGENTIKLAIEAKERQRNELKTKIDDFDFYQKEQNINFDLVRFVENQISELNKKEYVLSHNSEKIRSALDSNIKPKLNINDIDSLFKETGIYFPQNLTKDYTDLLKFTEQITKERDKYLKNELIQIDDDLKKTQKELEELNKKRSSLLSSLKEKDTFVKYKNYQNDLIQIENEIYSFKQKLEGSLLIKTYQDSINTTNEKLKEISNSIKIEILKDNTDYQEIRKLFQDIYREVFGYTALLIVEPNTAGNVEFTTTVLNSSDDLTSKADGYTSTKILCASFVLSVLIHYSEKSFYRFAYHDGLLESWGDIHKINFIKLVRKYAESNGIQFIISLIKSDVPKDFNFVPSEIVRTLSKNDLLFGIDF